MESPDVKKIKASLKDVADSDKELDETFHESEKYKLELQKINNKHELDLKKAENGILGQFIGSQSNVASMGAIICIIAAIIGFFWFNLKDNPDSQNAERILAIGLSALTYLFGKSQSD
ncbi:MAG: hypothetical protein HWD86_04180 [Kangiellaceae bacterium]|nr:hypothetical protein [Kangiellaceae bacterium]